MDARPVAGACWTNPHGIAQLRHRDSLQLATGTDHFAPLLRSALDTRLGPEGAR